MDGCLHSLDGDEFYRCSARGEVQLKLLLGDVHFGGELPWDGGWGFGLELCTELEQLGVDPVEHP